MIDTLICNVSLGETRVAMLNSGRTVSVIHERGDGTDKIGNIFLGRVARIEPNLDAAFVDIGLERSGFLKARYATSSTDQGQQQITRVVHEGQALLVQISRQPRLGKGALLTGRISLPGRYLVLSPGGNSIRISRRIDDANERVRLEKILVDQLVGDDGFVVRTAAENAPNEALIKEMAYLRGIWQQIRERRESESPPACLYRDSDPLISALRDHPEVNLIISDSSSQIAHARQLNSPYFSPERVGIEFYQGVEPIFERFAVEPALEEALGAQVELASGGTLFIEIGEALTAIDVNSARSQRGNSPEQTALITNLEAARETLRQIRLRDIAGLVVIDFVNLRERENRHRLMVEIREAASDDTNITRILDISELGLVELVRRRTHRPLSETILEDCPHCGGSGQRKSAESVALEIVRDVLRHARNTQSDRITVLVAPSVTEILNGMAAKSDLTEALERPVEIHVQEDFEHDEFEIAVNNVP